MTEAELPSIVVSVPHIPFPAKASYPARTGNVVRPLVDGEPAFRRIGEAIKAARHSVWLTVAFIVPGFTMPDGGGSLLDVLDGAVERGLDVRVIFWRTDPATSGSWATFSGSAADRDELRRRRSRVRIRWDQGHGSHCQHQKSWIVDAGRDSEVAFVGGINLNPRAMVSPGHRGDGQIHDVYAELAGPAASDVHHNFVQRWNEASERMAGDGVWGHRGDESLAFPTRLSRPRGSSLVQIQRTMPAGRYSDGKTSPEAAAFAIAEGERSIFEQYLLAIDAARRTIYIENQAIPIPPIAARLEAALKRGVQVVVLVPADPEDHVRAARRQPDHQERFSQLAQLGRHERFALAGIAGRNSEGGRSPVYVHSKIMLVDDAWATIGSCNLHAHSLFGHTELNASLWDLEVVRALRCELLGEHLESDTRQLDDAAAFCLFREVARANRARRHAGDHGWQGLAFALDPAAYGE